MSKFDKINTFITVIESQSFTAAAKKLEITTASVSRQISRLETELGAQLLERTTRQIKLTKIGNEYYHQCKKTIKELLDLENIILDNQCEPQGELNILSTRYFSEHYFFPRLDQFMSLYPKLQIKLELAERFPDLEKENIDLVFGLSTPGTLNLVRRRATSTRFILCASPEYFKKYGMPKTRDELVNHRYIAHSSRKPRDILTFNDDKTVFIEPTLLLNDGRAILDFALRGMGLVKLHDYLVKEAIANKDLIEIFGEYQNEIPIYLYYQQSHYLQAKIRKFVDFFIN